MGKIMLNDIEYSSGGSGGSNDVELTWAEYQALSYAEKMNGSNYFITDASSKGKLIQPVIYSDEEREVGVWRDGKPLYQKTWVLQSRMPITNDYTSYLIDDVSVYNIDNIVWSEVYDNNDSSASLERIWVLSPIQIFIDNSAHLIAYYPQNNVSKATAFTLQYTKTTDTPGSGKWVPSGVSAVHYSEDEQVIGTWIDGKPLYQKTIHVGALTKDTNWHEVPHGISNFKKLVDIKGVCDNDGTPTESYPISGYRPNMTNGFIFSASVSSIFYMNNWNNIIDCYVTLTYTKTTD